MSKFNSLTFIIFTYNSGDLIERNLNHIKAAIDYNPIEHEIIVVDNNSTDNTVQVVKKFIKDNHLDIKIVKNDIKGIVYSRIEGIKRATKDFISLIDDDNFIDKTWIAKLKGVIENYNPDVIGCRTICIADVPFPKWWQKYKGNYACGSRFTDSGYLNNPLHKMWSAGLSGRAKFLKPAMLLMEPLCIGSIKLRGEDSEINYRMRLMGARFYISNDLVLKHYMRTERLTKKYLLKIREGSAYGAINLDVYKYLLTNKRKYKLFNMAILILLGTPILSFRYKINYLKFALLRFKTLKQRQIIQKKIKTTFLA